MLNFPLFPRAAADWYHLWQLDESAVWIFACLWVFALGSCFGSFLNVCIWRIPRRESLSRRASHCTTCNAPIRWFDNIPVFSYLILRGKCRHCHAPYSPRYLFVELLCGTLFAAILLKTALCRQPWETAVNYAIAVLYCVAAGWIDAEHGIIPDKLTFPVFILALLSAFFLPGAWGEETGSATLIFVLLSALIPVLLPLAFALFGHALHKDLFGWGDCKFLFVCAMLIGMCGAFAALLFAALTAMTAGTFQALRKKENPLLISVPFSPYLGAGVILWIFGGQWIIRGYFLLTGQFQ